jgi:hypothetical protein
VADSIRSRLYQRRWVLIVLVVCGLATAGFYEFSIRRAETKVGPVAVGWIRTAPLVRRFVGDVASVESDRSLSRVTWDLDGAASGRLHYLVRGSKGELDLFVLWRQKTSDASPIIEKVQWQDTRGFETIWP